MVGKVHESKEFRPSEDARLDQAMTSMDPILQASLQREQQQRLRKKLLYGGIVMGILLALLAVVFSNHASPAAEPGKENKESVAMVAKAEQKTEEKDPIAVVANAEQLGSEGWRLWQSGKAKQAQAKFEKALKLDPKNPHLWNGLGWSYVHIAKYDKAIEAFNRCIKIESKHGGALNGLGQSYFFKREYDLAEPYLKRSASAAMVKGQSAADFGLARLYILKGDFAKAKPILTEMKKKGIGEIDPSTFDAMLEAADSETLPEKLKSELEPPEIDAAEHKVADDGRSAADRNGEGWGHFRSGNNRAAELAFRDALKKAPKMEAAQNGLGFALLNQGKTDEAKPIFEKLVAKDPKGGGYVNGLGRCYEAAGDLEKAIKIWKTFDKGKGPATAITSGLGRSLFQLERYDEALPYLERVKKAGSDHVDKLIAKCKAAQDK